MLLKLWLRLLFSGVKRSLCIYFLSHLVYLIIKSCFSYFQMLLVLQILMYILVLISKMSQINGSVPTAHLLTIQLLMYVKCASYQNLLLAGHHFYLLHLVHVIVIQKKTLYQYRVDIFCLK